MQPHPSRQPLAVVCVAAPEDAALLARWETHLHPLLQGQHISFWSERHLTGGADRMGELRRQVDSADLIVLLLSADFFANPECSILMEQALERLHGSTVRVIPLLLRPAAWQESPLSELVPWPSNGMPITQWDDQEAAWQNCVQELRRLLGHQVVSKALPSGRSHKHVDPDWERMVRLLARSYKELLDQSLHGIAWIELGLARRPDLVSNVTTLLFRFPQGERLSAPGTSVVQVYNEAEGELLILGAPGSGKSTLSLDLAQRLVNRAQAGEIQQLPVILRLSSWAIRRPALADWMTEQLIQTYHVPRHLSKRWVQQGSLLPLLDGLDEMEEAARPACIAAINAYRRTHLAPLVVCSRHAEYEAVAERERLALQNAVIVQSLTDEQIEGYLSVAGPSFAGVQLALHQDHELRKLATTPLMLSVLLLTYRGVSAEEIIQQGIELEWQVWTDYVRRQVTEKGHLARYPLERTCAWLTFLAQQMRIHQQTIFYAEYLQTDWLALDQQRSAMWLAMRLPALVIGVCACFFILSFIVSGISVGNLFWPQIGLLGAFVGDSLSLQIVSETSCVRRHLSTGRQTYFKKATFWGILLAASYGLCIGSIISYPGSPPYSLSDWLRDGFIIGVGSGLSLWVFQKLLRCRPSQPTSISRTRPSWRDSLVAWLITIAPPQLWLATATLGVGMGLSSGLSEGLGQGQSSGPNSELGPVLGNGLGGGLEVGLIISITVLLIYAIVAGSIGSLRFTERIHWTWSGLLKLEHLRASLRIAGGLFLFVGLGQGLSSGLFLDLSSSLSYALSTGLLVELSEGLSTGLSIALSFSLSYWIILGLYQSVKQEHLEDQDRWLFNQGVRRSLRNGLLISLISAILISAIGVLHRWLSTGLNNGLRFGLNVALFLGPSRALSTGLNKGQNGLSEGLSNGLSFAWGWLLMGMIVMWSLSGGLTVLRHYVIRWLLARHRTFPFHAQAFLDDATTRILLRRVGGGYSFIHRRLQDYFANTAIPPSRN